MTQGLGEDSNYLRSSLYKHMLVFFVLIDFERVFEYPLDSIKQQPNSIPERGKFKKKQFWFFITCNHTDNIATDIAILCNCFAFLPALQKNLNNKSLAFNFDLSDKTQCLSVQ